MPLYQRITGSSVVDGTIAKADLDASVQASLDLADSALQIDAVTSVDGATGAVDLSDTYAPLPEGTPTVGQAVVVTDDDPLTLGYADAGPTQPMIFDIRDYGAKVDGRVVFDGATTNGSATFTSASANFTPADIGKTIVVRWVGAGNTELVTTISAVTNSTTATLALAASVTGSSLLATIATDDTTAVRAALSACAAAGGGTIYHPGGLCLLAGAPQTGTVSAASYSYAGVLNLPPRPWTSGQATIRFLGATPPPQFFYGVYTGEALQVESGCAIYQFTATSGNGVDVIPNASANALGDYYCSWTFVSDDLLWRFPNNPQCGGLKLLQCADARLNRTSVTVNSSANVLATPTGSTNVGLTLPMVRNNGCSEARNVNVYGFPKGIIHNEHTVLDNVYVTYCTTGIEIGDGPHHSTWSGVYVAQYATAVKPTGSCTLTGVVSFEPKLNGGPTYGVDIEDTAGYLYGELACTSNGGQYKITVNGCAKMHLWQPRFPAVPRTVPQALLGGSATSANFAAATHNSPRGLPILDTGQAWSTPGTVGISSGGAVRTGTGSDYAWVKSHKAGSDNPTVSITVTTGTTSAVGPAFLGDGNNTNQFNCLLVNGNAVQIFKGSTLMANASFSYSANTSYTVTADYGVTAAGTITMKVNGVTVVSYELTGAEQSAFAANRYAGFRFYPGVDSGSKITAFSVT